MALSEASPLLYNQVLNIPSSDGVANIVLVANTARQVAIPSGARGVTFAFNQDIWVTYGLSTACAVPSSYSSAGSTASQEFNPTIRHIGVGTTSIYVVSGVAASGSMSFYK